MNERFNEKEQNAFKAVGPQWARRAAEILEHNRRSKTVQPLTLQIFNELMAGLKDGRFQR